MSKNEFDDLLLRKFQEEDFPYKKESWEKLRHRLPAGAALPRANHQAQLSRLKKRRIAYGIAAGIALLSGLFITGRFLQEERPESARPSAAISGQQEQGHSEPEKEPAGIAGTQPEKSIPDPQDSPHTNKPLSQDSGQLTMVSRRLEESPKSQVAGTLEETIAALSPALPDALPNVSPDALPNVFEKEDQDNTVLAPTASDNAGQPALAQDWSAQDKQQYYNSLLNPASEPTATAASRTTISVGGGVNYGTLNTGYALGLSARQNVGNHFFLEGNVGMLYNNNARNVADYKTISGFNAAARPSSANSMKLNAPALSPVENLYYFQINPAVGYAINDQFAVSVGGDLQHLITADAESPKVQYSAEEVRIFPVLDFGLTGKTEFSITPEIQAGIVYREGLSAWLQADPGTSYLNRRYIQVQFKYSLSLGK